MINRVRQYGKTTTLYALETYLENEYIVVSLDFQLLSHSDYESEEAFVSAFARSLLQEKACRSFMGEEIQGQLRLMKQMQSPYGLSELFICISQWCGESEKPVVLLIDEVDQASNDQVFLDFLAQLRGYDLNRRKQPTLQSVILAGVHDIRNLKQKIRPDAEHNSPWNIATKFDVDMSFSVEGIAGMLTEYENDHHTGMDVQAMAQLIYDYTSGYPVLVSMFCKLLDEDVFGGAEYPTKTDAWTKEGVLQAEKLMNLERMPLLESLINKLEQDKKLRKLLYSVLFTGEKIPFSLYDASLSDAMMYGFLKEQNSSLVM